MGWILPPPMPPSTGHLATSGYQETFLVVTTEVVILASSGQKPGRLLTNLQMHRTGSPTTKQLSGPKYQYAQRLRKLALVY